MQIEIYTWLYRSLSVYDFTWISPEGESSACGCILQSFFVQASSSNHRAVQTDIQTHTNSWGALSLSRSMQRQTSPDIDRESDTDR